MLAIGLAYDLWAKGTTLSWLPFALGIPLLPVYGWYGATGSLPELFLVLVPAAANAGAALAVANAMVDYGARRGGRRALDRPRARRRPGWGWPRGRLNAVVAVLALGTAIVLGRRRGGWSRSCSRRVPMAGAVLGAGGGGRPGTSWRELAWEIQAMGLGLLAVAWLGARSASSGPDAGV